MTNFDYQLNERKLLSFKYVHELEAFIRSNTGSRYRQIDPKKDFPAFINLYKTYKHALKLYGTKSKSRLPDFIYDYEISYDTALTAYLFAFPDQPSKITYDEFIDIFQYTHRPIEANPYSPAQNILKSVALLVEDKPQPYGFYWNQTIDSKYYEVAFEERTLALIADLEHFKQTHNLVNNTVIEAELAVLYKLSYATAKDVAHSHNFVTEMVSVFNTIGSKITPL